MKQHIATEYTECHRLKTSTVSSPHLVGPPSYRRALDNAVRVVLLPLTHLHQLKHCASIPSYIPTLGILHPLLGFIAASVAGLRFAFSPLPSLALAGTRIVVNQRLVSP